MKFTIVTIVAIIASTSAIMIKAEAIDCISLEQAKEGFISVDTKFKNETLSYDGMEEGLDELAKYLNHTISKEEWEWIEETGGR